MKRQMAVCWSIRVCFVARLCRGLGRWEGFLWLLVLSEGVEDCIWKYGLGVV